MRHKPAAHTRMRKGRLAERSGRVLGDCTLFNVEDGGVGVTFASNTPLPESFLVIDERAQSVGIARALWRNGVELGIEFSLRPMPHNEFKEKFKSCGGWPDCPDTPEKRQSTTANQGA